MILVAMWLGAWVGEWISASGVTLPAYVGAMLVVKEKNYWIWGF